MALNYNPLYTPQQAQERERQEFADFQWKQSIRNGDQNVQSNKVYQDALKDGIPYSLRRP